MQKRFLSSADETYVICTEATSRIYKQSETPGLAGIDDSSIQPNTDMAIYTLVTVNTAPERAKRLIGRVVENLKDRYTIVHVANCESN